MKYLVLILIFILQCSPVSAASNILRADFRHRPPEMIVDGDNISGVLKDIIEEAAEKIGYSIEWRIAPFSESLDGLKTGKVDIVPRTIRNKEREAFVNYLGPISIQRKDILFLVHKGKEETIKGYEDLRTLRIGAKPKTSYFSRFDNDPDLNKVLVDTDQNVARLFADNRVDALTVLDPEPLEKALLKLDYTNYTYAEYRHAQSIVNYYGMSRTSQHADIFSLLQEKLQAMKTSGRIDELYKKHGITKELSDHNPFNLTLAERNWLESHPGPFKVHNELNWPPFNFNENGQPKGFSIDLIDLIANKLGVPIEYINGPSWNEFLEMSRNGTIDIMLNIALTQDRQKYLEFTDSYIRNPVVIVSRKGGQQFGNISELNGKKVAVPKGFFFEELIRRNHPEIKLMLVENQDKTVQALEAGKVDATIGSFAVLNYLISSQLISTLQISAIMPNEVMPGDLRFGIRKEWSPLRDIIQKVLGTVTREEFSELRKKWFGETAFDGLRFRTEEKGETETANVIPSEFQLTDSEKTFLKEHPVIRVHNETSWAPFNFSKNNSPMGFSIDYMNLVAEKLGFQIDYVTGPTWDEFMGMVKKKELDVMLNIVKTEEREKFLNFTDPYNEFAQALFTREGTQQISSVKDLYGKKFALQKGFHTEELLKGHPQVELVFVKDIKEAILAVSTGRADALLDVMPVIDYNIRQLFISNLKPGGQLGLDEGKPFPLSIGVRKDWGIFRKILNKGMNSIAEDEMNDLRNRWLGFTDISEVPKVLLTEEEKNFLKEHNVIRVHNEEDWPPFNYYENGKPQGLSIEYMNLLAEKLGIRVQYDTGPEWNEFLGMIKEKEIDVMLNIVKTEERQKYILFTEHYAINPNAIISTHKNRYGHIEELTGKTVAIAKGYFHEEIIARDFPQIKLLPVKNSLESLKAVSFGKADAAVVETAVASILINRHILTNLSVSGELDFGDSNYQNLRIGVRNDWPLLQSVLMKAMDEITPQEMNQLRQKWIVASETEAVKAPSADDGISFGRLIVFIIAVFLVLSLLVWLLLRIVKKEDIAFSFGSRLFRIIVLIGLSVFIIIVCVLGWFTLERNKREVLEGVGESLDAIVNTANDRLTLWVEQKKSFMKLYGRNPELVEITKCLLSIPPNRDDLLKSGLLCNARTFFNSNEEIFSNIGFFIISPDHISLASMRDTNIGTQNLISLQRPDLLERAFRGEVLFVPPIQSDVDLGQNPKSGKDTRQYTKFFLAPIQDLTGEIIAVFTLRIDPLRDFSKALRAYGMLKSGETYAFNEYGRMISESLFTEQLRQIGLIEEEQHSGMNIEIRDPGGNMVDGFRPEAESSGLPFTRMVSSALELKSYMDTRGLDKGFSNIGISTKAYRDYRGVEVFGAWLWSDDLGMGLASEIDADEAMESFYSTRATVFGVLGFTLILSVGAILFVMILGERASRALIRARDTLEEKVEERTSELRQKQEQLVEAEQQSSLLLNSAGEGIFGVNPMGQVTFINPSAASMLNYHVEEIIGQKVHQLIHHTHADGSPYPLEECYMYKAYTEGTSHHVEDEMLWRKDGTSFSVEYSSTPLLKGNKLIGAVITFRDITERKAAEERFSALLESAPDAMIVSDDEGKMTLVNSQVENLFGYPREELLGQKIDMLVPEEIREVHPDYRASFYADPNLLAMGTGLNFVGISKDGQRIPVDISLSPIETDEGFLVVASIRDITERKQAEEELKESEKRFLSLFDDSPVSLWEEDWSEVKDYFDELKNEGISNFRSYFEENPYEVNHCARLIKILNVNKITLKLHEVKDIDELMENLGKIFTEDTTEILREELIALAEGETSFEGETIHSTLSGKTLNIALQLNVIPGSESSLDKLLVSMIDITERIKTEREVKEKYGELERFRRMAVGRENKMIELKKEINEHLIKNGFSEKYKIH